ncbi:FbpB family small basic protein [Litchfieldia salsa]|uniref:Fur-regulated basic protein B n=1 Tax=Litchfieldia salsa TaxID=930152 RepID=A0A1H0WX02_9BACI|nr:FbpB family small basic protein [Litchfieldia salsa]SDP95278.1 Fur-regulated basic protein B [Litchfieldia salsa]
MKKSHQSLSMLILRNKEELLRDKTRIEQIEKRIEDRI